MESGKEFGHSQMKSALLVLKNVSGLAKPRPVLRSDITRRAEPLTHTLS